MARSLLISGPSYGEIVRLTPALLVAVLAINAGCSSERAEDGETGASSRGATIEMDAGGGLPRLASLLDASEDSRCVEELEDASRSTSGGKTVAAVARDVEHLRRLRFEKLPTTRYLTGRAFDRRVERWLDEYRDGEIDVDGRILVALGALPPGSDLRALLRRQLRSGVAGFYDPESRELVVDAGKDGKLDGIDHLLLAHELEHALADQALKLPEAVGGDEPAEGREDAALAAAALVEGDATVVMWAYAVENVSLSDTFGALTQLLASERELAGLPHYLRNGMRFPYDEGVPFVCALYERGGWRAVDRAYRRPPASSAEVMFPERFWRGERPVDPPDPPTPGVGWRRIDRQALGAADLLLLFEAPGGDEERALDDVRERVAAWVGGELHAWARGDRTAVALGLVDRGGGRSLCESMKAWRAAARMSGVVRCSGRHVRVGIAPDAGTAARLVSS
jgi:hypothetical protein